MNESGTDRADEEDDRKRSWWWLLAVLVATAAVYARSLEGELVYDDKLLIAQNPGITELSNLPSLFARSYWEFLEEDAAGQIGYWRPLTAVADSLAWAGGDGAPWVFHMLCVLVHLAATTAAFFFVLRLTRSTWVAGFSALLFGLHPTHVESVAWISALNDPMYGLFTLLALHAWLRWRENGSRGRPVATCIWFAAGLLSKEMAAATLPLLVVLDVGRRQDADGRAPWWKPEGLAYSYGPLLGVLAVYLVARMFVFGSVLAGFERVTTDFAVGAGRLALLRVELIGQALWLLAWPAELALFRPFRPHLPASDPQVLRSFACIAVFLGLLAYLVIRRARPALFALLMIPAGFLPVLISVNSLGSFPFSDRFLYIPVLGFVLLGCLALERLVPRHVGSVVLLVTAGLYGVKSWDRVAVWENEEVLFRTSVAEAPRSPYVHWGLGRVLIDRFQQTDDERYLEEAFLVYERAQKLLLEAKQPQTDIMVSSRDYLQVNLGLGWCYVFDAQRDPYAGYTTPIALFEELARLVGELEDRSREVRSLGIQVRDEHLELYQVWTALGTAQGLSGDLEQAKISLKKALSLYPDYPQAHQNLGRVYARENQWDLAIHHFREAAEKRAGNFEDQLLLAQTLQTAGKSAEAEELARQMVERFPEQAEPLIVLATIRLAQHEPSEALTYIDRALLADPGYAHAWYQKARALLELGVNETATIQAFRKAVELMPGNFEANYDFAAHLLRTGAVSAAQPYLISAYATAVDPRHVQVILQQLTQQVFESAAPLFRLANVEVARGRYDLAETWLNQAQQVEPGNGEVHFQKARVLRRLDRDEEALGELRTACRLMPESYLAHSELAAYLTEVGETDAAIRALERTLELEPPVEWEPELREQAKQQLQLKLSELRAGSD